MTFENGYAVVIGVDENQLAGLELPTVAKDVKALHEVLIHPERCAYDPENVKLLYGAESTKNNILEALSWLKEKVDKDPDATAVFYYSGHGWVDETDNQYHLIPYDIKSLEKLRLYALKSEDFTSELESINPQRMLIILDCCHSGGMGAKNVNLANLVQQKKVHPASFPLDLPGAKSIPESKGGLESKAISDLKKGNGRAVLNSSTGSQLSWTRADGQMSLFTYHLIEALTGHAPHPDDAKVVLVTDVMSWVTFEVEKSAASIQKDQTPIMQTTGVFPVAQLIGGQGVALSKGISAPDPLAPLPKAGDTITTHQEGQQVEKQYNIGKIEGGVGHMGDNINNYGDTIQGSKIDTSGGDYIGGDKVGRDKFKGDKVGRDKIEGVTISGVSGGVVSLTGDAIGGSQIRGDQITGDKISTGDISGSQGIGLGRESQTTVQTTTYQSQGSGNNLNVLFAPLHQIVAQQNPGLSRKVNALKEQVALGSGADDNILAGLVQDLADGVPAAKPAIVSLFNNPAVSNAAGQTTKFIVGRMR